MSRYKGVLHKLKENATVTKIFLFQVWDLRKNSILYHMKGHSDTVTGLALSPDGSFVVSNSMDNSLRVWDIRPFAPQERCIKMMVGHAHNFEKVFSIFG
jgi:Prp8 binding protein